MIYRILNRPWLAVPLIVLTILLLEATALQLDCDFVFTGTGRVYGF